MRKLAVSVGSSNMNHMLLWQRLYLPPALLTTRHAISNAFLNLLLTLSHIHTQLDTHLQCEPLAGYKFLEPHDADAVCGVNLVIV